MGGEKRRLGALALAAGAAGIAFSAVLNKTILEEGLSPLWLNVFRLGFSCLFLLPFFLRDAGARKAFGTLTRREKGLTLLSGLMLAGHFASWAAALAWADSLIAASIWSTFSLLTVLGSALVLGENTPVPALLGMVLAVCGVAICAADAQGARLLGVAMAALAAVTQAVYTLCGRAVRKKLDVLPYTMAVYSVALGALLLAALLSGLPDAVSLKGLGVSMLLALVCTLGGHSMQNYALRFYKAPTVSAVFLTEVFTGPALVFFILGEAPPMSSVLGGVVILLGVGWYMLYEWRVAHGLVPSRRKPQECAELPQ